MKQQFIFLALSAICAVVLSAPGALKSLENNMESVFISGLGDVADALDPSSCVKTLYVLAFTSGIARADSDSTHRIQLISHGVARDIPQYNRPGDDMQNNKGDLWVYPLTEFGFSTNCMQFTDIQGAAILAGGNDGWNIESIATIVGDGKNRYGLLTADFNVNRWIDGDESSSQKHFTLTRL